MHITFSFAQVGLMNNALQSRRSGIILFNFCKLAVLILKLRPSKLQEIYFPTAQMPERCLQYLWGHYF